VPEPSPDKDVSPDRSFRALLALSFLVPLLLFLGAAWYDYTQEASSEQRQIISTTDALAEHAQKVLDTSELVLSLMTDRVRGMDWTQIRSDLGLHSFLVQLTHQLPQFESAFLVDPAGSVAASSRAFPMPFFDVTDREYFRAAADGNSGLFFSAPFRGQMARTVAFTVTRPRDPAAPAAGLLGLTISPKYFKNFYESVLTASGDAAALIRTDGVFLVRYPDAPGLPRSLPADSPIMAALKGQISTIYEAYSALDNQRRIGAVRQLHGVPVFAEYSNTIEEYLSDWYRHVAVLAAFAALLAAVLSIATTRAVRAAQAERASLKRLLDETARREQAEEALRQAQKMEALGHLTGGVAHDFNNLLTAILGALELARKRVNDPNLQRLLDGAMGAARRGAQLVKQMLAFSRRQDVAMRPVAVNAVLRGIDELLRRTLGPDIRLEYALQPDLWPAQADQTQLEVAALNLAINARDAMPDGGTLRLETANLPAGAPRPGSIPAGDFVLITVADTGTGMSEDVRRRAFDPFFTTKGVGRGTGPGLSMVHGFAQQAGGSADIESVPGRGTSVRLYLPRGTEIAPQDSVDRVAAQDSDVSPLRVLLVDDDEAVRELARDMLHELGHTVIVGRDGAETVQLSASDPPPQLLLADFAMPGMNGAQVAASVLRIRPGVRVLFMTGFAENDGLAEWTAGGVLTLTKPFTLSGLASAIRETIHQPAKVVPLGAASRSAAPLLAPFERDDAR
jgi:signal transduction histidine kinase/ActR/RegA family two-component response regulator